MKHSRLINFKKFSDGRGNLTAIESSKDIPFNIKRIYFLYDIPEDKIRGEHAHKNLEQLILCLGGSFDIIIDDGFIKKKYTLNDPSVGLYVPKMHWRILENFSKNSTCLVLASEEYSEDDYYRNYNDFLSNISLEK
jgi:hypothetical protein